MYIRNNASVYIVLGDRLADTVAIRFRRRFADRAYITPTFKILYKKKNIPKKIVDERLLINYSSISCKT